MSEEIAGGGGLKKYLARLESRPPPSPIVVRGRVREVTGLIIRASVPDARIGDLVRITCTGGEVKLAEVVGFKDELAVCMPLGEVDGVGPDAEVEPTGEPLSMWCGEALLGRVLNGLGEPIDGGPDLRSAGCERWAVMRTPPNPLTRRRVTEPLGMGVRAIDGLLTFGEGQRVGLFAGSGVGKSTLMGQIAKQTDAEIVILCLIGERGREVRDFLEEVLGEEGLRRSVVVCATSDTPSMVRLKSAYVATAVAEWFRDRGKSVLLMMDSVTRFARAQREIGLAAGEPPARRGYPPSVFSMLPRLLERTGNSATGSITALYTVLVAGGDMEEPIADEVRGIVDGHILLSRKLATRNHWPAIDVLPSLSRVMNGVVTREHREAAGRFREVLSAYEEKRDLIALGAYQYGTDDKIDEAIDLIEELEDVLKQGLEDYTTLDETVDMLLDLFG